MTPRRARSVLLRDPAPVPDADVMRRLATGELDALGELYDRHHAPVRTFVARMTCDAEDVDDLVHETFLAAAKASASYDGRASCRPWLIGIAVQLLRRRRQRFGMFFQVLQSVRSTARPHVDPRDALEAKTDIEWALRQLTEPKRLAILMAEVDGMSCAEIALALEVPIGTVWTRLHSARREMLELLGEEAS